MAINALKWQTHVLIIAFLSARLHWFCFQNEVSMNVSATRKFWSSILGNESISGVEMDKVIVVRNMYGQEILRLDRQGVRNLQGQILFTIQDDKLLNQSDQLLAYAAKNKAYSKATGQLWVQVDGNDVKGLNSAAFATIEGGTQTEKALLGAAFLLISG